jgi:hypothetical protein
MMEFSTGNEGTAPGEAGADKSSTEALAALRRFARTKPAVERCELCGLELGPEHPHLLDQKTRQIACSCDACAICFCGQEGAKFLRVPRRVLKLESFAFDDLQWEEMMLPINMAFFLRDASGETSAMYPSPAGAMSSQLGLPVWKELFAGDPVLLSVEPEVEALIVNRVSGDNSYLIAPLDACYRLVGIIRTKWRGLSGGPDVWQAVNGFFTELESKATYVREAGHA